MRWTALVGLWTLPPLFALIALSVRLEGGPPPVPWGRFLLNQLLLWYPWIPLTPLIAGAARRWPPHGSGWPRHILVHALLSLATGLAFTAWLIATEVLAGLDPATIPIAAVLAVLVSVGGASALVYWMVLGGVEVIGFYRRSREREAQLARARLEALRSQIQPHFLFNTLHAATSLMSDDVPGARRMIAKLSELLRASLAGDEADEVPLDEELALVDLYLDIERVRFADHLEVHREVAPEAAWALVPQLILQPLVENAVRHGISRSSSAGRLRLTAYRNGDTLLFDVADDGPGLGAGAAPAEGVGLSNVRGRLAALYGEAGSLTLENRPGGGCRARLEIPWRTGGD